MGSIKFKINGEPHSVGSEVSSHVTLLDYVRNSAGLKGTKYMCREGGCGACILSAKKSSSEPFSVNSCLIPITSCHGWEITTIEDVGNRNKGYHKLQTELAEGFGSQCGYCSPAWIMSMYSLLISNPDITMLEIEKSLASNTCRCTGYRPILETFKKFAKDAPRQIILPDIEDLRICKKNKEVCGKSSCGEWCLVDEEDGNAMIEIKLKDDKVWVRAQTVKDIFDILNREGDVSYMLVNGNTAKGVYPIDEIPRVLIDTSGVKELKGYTMGQNLIINAGTTLTEFMEILKNVSKEDNYEYLEKFYDHVYKVAHVPVRNVATIAGNLMIKNQNKAFPSDIFLLLELVGAQVTIQMNSNPKLTLTMQQFLDFDMKGYVLLNVMLPPLNTDHHVVTFKIMPRSLHAHALINAGFLFELNSENVVQSTRILYGALSASFLRASSTEKFLVGKNLFTNETLTSALKILEQELVIDESPLEPSIEYRRNVALGLFYKALLQLSPETNIHTRYRSGATDLHDTRPVSKSYQSFETDHSKWPLTQPITKVEALIQCAGEATYTEDLPVLPKEVFCAFALSTVAVGDIVSIDASKALAYPGVIAFYTAKDIPGKNTYIPLDGVVFVLDEEVLCSGSVKFFNQPIGIVVAETRHVADVAAKLVTATYTNVKDPIINIKDAINDLDRTTPLLDIPATEAGDDVTKVIEGSNTIYGQYHYTMETLVTVARPSDEGLEVYCTSQWMEGVQLMIAQALNIDQNKVDVHTRRIGGGFGFKIARNIQGAIATALVANKLNRPCRFIQSMTNNMKTIGKRFPCHFNYEVGVNSLGVMQYINTQIYQDNGYIASELIHVVGKDVYFNTYNKSKWHYSIYNTITDTASNTSMRGPGTLDNIAMAELVMERIAYEMKLDPLDVRLANIDEEYKSDVKEMVDSLMIKSEYIKRRDAVNKFNSENRWKKRGLRFALMRWLPSFGLNLDINLSVYRGDASVIITHGGIEMGQGVNTKAVQAAAYMLNIPTDKIIIKPNNTIIAPNSLFSGGSVTTQNVCLGVKIACQELLDRLKPVRDEMDNPTWEELISQAYIKNVDLQTHGFTRSDEDIIDIPVYGAALTEVELDVLTGEFEILRADIYEDVGESINPEVDIGQVEGAFIMGVGYWTCEHLIYDETGDAVCNRTWNYKVPLARDIPQDMRVYFRKNSYSKDKIFGSKTVGEAPICVSVSVAFALREAIVAARLDAGIPTTEWFAEDGPYTVERNHLLTKTNLEHFKFNN